MFLSQGKTVSGTSKFVTLRAANGLEIPYIGYLEGNVEFLGFSVPQRVILVLKDTQKSSTTMQSSAPPCLLGMNVLAEIMGETTEEKGRKDSQESKKNDHNELGFVKIAGCGKIRLPARSIQTITVSGWCGRRLASDETILVEPLPDTTKGLIVLRAACTPKGGSFAIKVVNVREEDIHLAPRSRIAKFCVGSVREPGEIEMVSSPINSQEVIVRQIVAAHASSSKRHLQHDVDLPGCTNEQRDQVKQLFARYHDVFATAEDDVGYTDRVRHTITTTDEKPVAQTFRRLPPNQYVQVKEHIRDLLKKGIIKESSSPYASPVVVVKKKDGSLRLCVDYRRLNEKTKKDAYPLPRIEESLDALRGSKYFSTLDLASGYHQVAMDDKHQEKTAFITPFGLFEYTRMPFGLCNAPATFQRLMQTSMNDLVFQILLVYLDDILVYASSFEEHLHRLEIVLSRLREIGLKLNPEKCSFFKQNVKYLGHTVSAHGIATDDDKVSSVKNWPVPSTLKELRAFLGFASYYRRFVKDFAKIAGPLHHLVGALAQGAKHCGVAKGRRVRIRDHWTLECDTAFAELKASLTSAPVLGYADYNLPFVLETDACHRGLGAVLSQVQDGKKRVIAFASRTLRPSERNMRNYSSMKLELLALKWAITDKFRGYLLGSSFTCFTDNNPLSHLQTAKLGAVE